MPFRKNNQEINNKNGKGNDYSPNLYLSEFAGNISRLVASFSMTIIIILIWAFDIHSVVEKSDIQNILQMSVGLGAFAVAIPLLLKDFKVEETFWKSFLLLSSIFLISSLIGLFAIIMEQGLIEIKFLLIGYIGIIITINLTSIKPLVFFWKKKKSLKRKHNKNKVLFPSQLEDFIALLPFVVFNIIFCSNYSTCFVMMFTYGLLLFVTTIIASVINSLQRGERKEVAIDVLKHTIYKVVNNNPEKSFTDMI